MDALVPAAQLTPNEQYVPPAPNRRKDQGHATPAANSSWTQVKIPLI